jgi:hypothetical protein
VEGLPHNNNCHCLYGFNFQGSFCGKRKLNETGVLKTFMQSVKSHLSGFTIIGILSNGLILVKQSGGLNG